MVPSFLYVCHPIIRPEMKPLMFSSLIVFAIENTIDANSLVCQFSNLNFGPLLEVDLACGEVEANNFMLLRLLMTRTFLFSGRTLNIYVGSNIHQACSTPAFFNHTEDYGLLFGKFLSFEKMQKIGSIKT